jgi:hypothetical protein
LFYGTQGTVFATDTSWSVWRPGQEREDHAAPVDLGTRHMAEFLEAVRSRQQPGCTIDDGFRSTATVQLAMIAYQTGSTVRWDSEAMQIVDNPAAAALLQRPYRAPWRHPYAS